jgi:hypothetical protein
MAKKNVRFTLHLPPTIIERVRKAAYFTPGETIAAICERAIAREIDAIERANGEPFGEVPGGKLKGGRPIKYTPADAALGALMRAASNYAKHAKK